MPEADIAMAARKIVQAGRKTKRRNTGPTLTLGTIKAVHDYDGNMVADVTVRGADLLGLDMTVDCVNAQPGDRCVIQEQAHHAMVTGILAKPGAWVPVTRMLWQWSSDFDGTPQATTDLASGTFTLHATTLVLVTMGVRCDQNAQYGLDANIINGDKQNCLYLVTSTGTGIGNFFMSNVFVLEPATYTVRLATHMWNGTPNIHRGIRKVNGVEQSRFVDIVAI